MNSGSNIIAALALAAVTTISPCTLAVGMEDYPEYKVEHEVVGPIRSQGGTLGGQYRVWEEAFKKYHPQARFIDELVTSESSIGGLVSGASDLGPAGREAELMDLLPFVESFGYFPTYITVGTGAWDPGKKGGSGSIAILVNRQNPITKVTIDQLDGIFGAARTGGFGFDGVVWSPKYARGADQDIRTWGQAGLAGKWRNQTINTYGYAFTGMRYFFQLHVMHGADRFNPTYREYVETESKMVDRTSPDGLKLTIKSMLKDLSNDPNGIAFVPLHYAKEFPNLKPLAIQPRSGGPYVAPSRESYQSRTYPLTRSIYIFLNRPPGHPVRPDVREFLRFVLSRQGQQAVIDHGRYLHLPASKVREELKKIL